MTTTSREPLDRWFQDAPAPEAAPRPIDDCVDVPAMAGAESDARPMRMPVPSDNSLIVRVITTQLICTGLLTLIGWSDRILLATAAVLPALLALSLVTVRSRTPGEWILLWLSWRRRHRVAGKVSASGDPVNPLWLLNRRLRVGSIRGFRQSDVGVLHLRRAWISVAWVTTGPRAEAPGAPDGLTALLDLPPGVTPGTTTFAVVQQTTTDLGAGPVPVLSAWLTLNVQPLSVLDPGQAIDAVPRLTRTEIRRINQQCTNGLLTVAPLDSTELLQALASTTEVPLVPSSKIEPVIESWQLWQARGRFHRAFRLYVGTEQPLPVLLSLAMDLAGRDADCVLTASVPLVVGRRRLHELPVLRVSCSDEMRALSLSEQIMSALEHEGAATAPLSGEQGPAVLATSVLAGAGRE